MNAAACVKILRSSAIPANDTVFHESDSTYRRAKH
jgi:hypothetical protein